MASLLLVEPDKLLAASYRRALERAGHTVRQAASAESALDAMDQQAPDLIILEFQLVSHNGIELLYEIRSYPEWDGVPVLLHTFVSPTHPGLGRQLWRQLGIIDYLYKPQTSLTQLVQRVDHVTSAASATPLTPVVGLGSV